MTVSELTDALQAKVHPRLRIEQVVLNDVGPNEQAASISFEIRDTNGKRMRAFVGPFPDNANIDVVFKHFLDSAHEILLKSFPPKDPECSVCGGLQRTQGCKLVCTHCGAAESCEDLVVAQKEPTNG